MATTAQSESGGALAGGDVPQGEKGAVKNTKRTKLGFAEMFKGGVIMDVKTPEQARIAEKAGISLYICMTLHVTAHVCLFLQSC